MDIRRKKMFDSLEKVLGNLFVESNEPFTGEVKILKKGFFLPQSLSCCVYNYASYND